MTKDQIQGSGISRLSDQEAHSKNFIIDAISTIPKQELALNLGLFIDQRLMSRLLFLNFLYQKILRLQGVIMDVGTRWGNTAVILQNLRAIYEPYNYQRKIIAFDTFQGLLGACEADGDILKNADGLLSTSQEYEKQLHLLMTAHERSHPISQITKFEIVKGDITDTMPEYISQHQETLVALAFFDLDLYRPTKAALAALKPRLMKGSILVFDQLNYEHAPGETLALLDSFDLPSVSVQRFEHCSRVSYIVL